MIDNRLPRPAGGGTQENDLRTGEISPCETCGSPRDVSLDRHITTVVHCKREKFDVYIGRPSKWGNPFVLGRDGNREQVLAKYRAYLLDHGELLVAIKPELKGRVLGCWCAPQACHGDVLAELADSE